MSNETRNDITTAPQETPASDNAASELDALRRENERLRARVLAKAQYIRNKTNELLEVMGTKPLRPEELDDETLVELDPLGIITGSIKHVLENLKETNRQLHVVNEETSAIFAVAEVGILVIDREKRIRSCNNKLRELFFPDREISDVIGLMCHNMICHNSPPSGMCVCEMVLDAKETVRLSNCQLATRIFNVAATPIDNESGGIEDMVVVYNEITELKAAEEQLSRMNLDLENRIRDRTKQLEAAIKGLESFCYTVSHDLRAPLRHINGFAAILSEDCEDTLSELGKDCLHRICKSSNRMNMLIDDLLHLSRVSQTDLVPVEVDLSGIAEKIFAMYRDLEPDRNVRSIVREGLSALCDAALMEIVLQNLIGNAWKYSADNPEAVIEFGHGTLDDKDVYYIRDNGVGFDMAYHEKLFKVFERLHGQKFEGTGIGLATVQKIISRHGGEIWADGVVGKGATFYFTLPLS